MDTQKEDGLAANETASTPLNQYAKSTALTRFYGHDVHEPLTAEDREDLRVIAAAVERGYHIAVRCVDCGHWLASPTSVRRHRGPKCAARAGD